MGILEMMNIEVLQYLGELTGVAYIYIKKPRNIKRKHVLFCRILGPISLYVISKASKLQGGGWAPGQFSILIQNTW